MFSSSRVTRSKWHDLGRVGGVLSSLDQRGKATETPKPNGMLWWCASLEVSEAGE